MANFKTYVASFAVAASLMVLGGCRNGELTFASELETVKTLLGGGSETVVELVEPDEPGPPLIVGFNEIRVAIPYAGENGTSKTYASPDGVTIAMNSGFVTRASGIGRDLNASYLAADSPWYDGLASAADANAITDRIYEYWDQRRVKRDKFRCSLTKQDRAGGGAIVDETCKRFFEPVTFVNRYWLTSDGEIECSRQWFHPKAPPLQFFSTAKQALALNLVEQGC